MKDVSNTRLLIFAKLPRLGQVKTRLQPLLGAEACLALHYSLIGHALNLATQWKYGSVELWLSEPPSQTDLENGVLQSIHLPESVTLCYQEGANLGERMQHALQRALAQSDQAVLIGTDCPEQKASHLDQAVSLLQSRLNVVVQPAHDGGFVLIACSQKVPNLGGSIDWGTSRVLAQLENELREQHLSLGKIDTISDLDDENDFLLLQKKESSFLSKFHVQKKP